MARGPRQVRAPLALAFGLALAAGCPRPPVERPYPPPTAQQLLILLRQRQATEKGMNARVRATSFLGGERVRATVQMLIERAGRLRFEAEISLQGTVAILAVDGKDFSFLDLQHNVLRRGPACPENVAAMVRIPLAAADVAAVLLGDVPLAADAESRIGAAKVEWDAALGGDALTLVDERGETRVILVREKSGGVRVAAAERREGGRIVWRIKHDGETLWFAEGTKSFDDGVEVRFKDRAPGGPFPDTAFRLEPPPGTRIEDVGCEGAGG